MGAVGSDYVDPETEPLRQALAWQERIAVQEKPPERPPEHDYVRELEKQIWSLRNEKSWWRDRARKLEEARERLGETVVSGGAVQCRRTFTPSSSSPS